jgi:hypothetical protein
MRRGNTEPDSGFLVWRAKFSNLTADYPPNRFAWISIAPVKIKIHVRFHLQAIQLWKSAKCMVVLLVVKVYIFVIVMCAVSFNKCALICCAQFHVEEALIMASRPQRERHRPQRDTLPWDSLASYDPAAQADTLEP